MVEWQKSKLFKIFTLVLAAIFYILGFVIVLVPQPFLRFGYLGIFGFNLFGPGMFLVPTASRYFNILGVAIVTALGMAFNDTISWLAGKNGDVIFPRGRRVERIENNLKKYGPWILFLWALIPFPYDFVAIIAGYLEMSFWRFLLPTFFGRLFRFLILGSGAVAIWGKVFL